MQSFDEMPPVCMGGKFGMMKSMNAALIWQIQHTMTFEI